jgi:hypothetical protein
VLGGRAFGADEEAAPKAGGSEALVGVGVNGLGRGIQALGLGGLGHNKLAAAPGNACSLLRRAEEPTFFVLAAVPGPELKQVDKILLLVAV